jgi:uncharacterized protein YggU (UPF0235/DUF167 family)
MRVAAAPADGKANDALIALLAETLDVPRTSIEIAGGHASRDKTILVRGLSESEIDARLDSFAGAAA